jgi:hypothetical protein
MIDSGEFSPETEKVGKNEDDKNEDQPPFQVNFERQSSI